jgi:hypothetical protein
MEGEPIIDIEGLVYVDDWDADKVPAGHIAIDMLVARAVSPDMLEDEPQALQLLQRFRHRLIASLEHVNAALKSLPASSAR